MSSLSHAATSKSTACHAAVVPCTEVHLVDAQAMFEQGRLWEAHLYLKACVARALETRTLSQLELYTNALNTLERTFPREALAGVHVDLIVNKPDQTIYGSVYIHPRAFHGQADVEMLRAMSTRPFTWLDLRGQGVPTEPVYVRFLHKARSDWYPFLQPVLEYDMYNQETKGDMPPQVSIACSGWEPHNVLANANFMPCGGAPADISTTAPRLALRLMMRDYKNAEDEASQSLDGNDDDDVDDDDGANDENSLGSFIDSADGDETTSNSEQEIDEDEEEDIDSSECVTTEVSDVSYMNVDDDDDDAADRATSRRC